MLSSGRTAETQIASAVAALCCIVEGAPHDAQDAVDLVIARDPRTAVGDVLRRLAHGGEGGTEHVKRRGEALGRIVVAHRSCLEALVPAAIRS
ncbi:hypothetical protein AB0L40_01245 [Patulibacter sp. NPDC049589]|uniref:hypothetical protein n=1 Tax=Patulibacter sp. NPDC049589 TaxID=3154731 RepID=UPI003445FA67